MGSRPTPHSTSGASRSARIIEFTGAPGSGKSTLVSHALARAREQGLRVVERDALLELYLENGLVAKLVGAVAPASEVERTRLRIHQRIEIPLLMRCFAKRFPSGWERFQAELAVLRDETPEEHARVERWVQRGIRQLMMARARSSLADLVLCDEGIAHRSVNLFARPGFPVELARLRDFLSGWAFPDVIVHVRASPKRCAARAWTRGVPKRLAGHSEAALLDFVAASAAVSAEIAGESRRRGLPTHEIENEYPSAQDLLRSAECEALLSTLVSPATATTRSGA